MFKVGETLKGIIIDWSDTESKGLREVIGEETAELVLKGCSVHWTRYYQKVAERVYCSVSKGNRRAAVEAFCLIAKNKDCSRKKHVLQLFDVLHDTGNIK